MAVILPIDAFHSMMAYKKFGSPNGYGLIVFGFYYFGEDNLYAGIYRRRPTKKGITIVKMRFYRPPVSRTDDQATQRNKFLAAVSAWQALSQAERDELKSLASRRSKRGYNVFLSKYLREN